MSLKSLSALPAVLALLLAHGYTQEGLPAKPLTVQEAVRGALSRNLDLARQERLVAAARADLRAAQADLWVPSIALSGAATFPDGGTITVFIEGDGPQRSVGRGSPA